VGTIFISVCKEYKPTNTHATLNTEQA